MLKAISLLSAGLIIRLLFGFVSDLSSSVKIKTNTETEMLSTQNKPLHFAPEVDLEAGLVEVTSEAKRGKTVRKLKKDLII